MRVFSKERVPVWAVYRSYNNACGLGVRDQALGLSVSQKKKKKVS